MDIEDLAKQSEEKEEKTQIKKILRKAYLLVKPILFLEVQDYLLLIILKFKN